jgi:hypothetical protein
LSVYERLYAVFRIPPFGSPKLRAVKKEQKHYHLDWALVPDMACRFENLMACHLLKWVHFEEDSRARDLELRYFRDVDGREVDFVVLENREPLFAVECKWDDAAIGKGLYYFKARFPNCRSFQISATGSKDYLSPEGIRVLPALKFLSGLI